MYVDSTLPVWIRKNENFSVAHHRSPRLFEIHGSVLSYFEQKHARCDHLSKKRSETPNTVTKYVDTQTHIFLQNIYAEGPVQNKEKIENRKNEDFGPNL